MEFPSVQFKQFATSGRGGDLGAIGTPVQHNGHQTHDAGQFHNGPQNHDGRGLKGTDSEQFDQLRALGRVSAGGQGALVPRVRHAGPPGRLGQHRGSVGPTVANNQQGRASRGSTGTKSQQGRDSVGSTSLQGRVVVWKVVM